MNIKRLAIFVCALVMLIMAGGNAIADGNATISQAKELLSKGGRSNQKTAAKLLREIVVSENEETLMPAATLLSEIKGRIRAAHPEVNDEEYEKAQRSVGRAILEKYGYEKAIDVLIEEAECLSSGAQIALEVLYEFKIEGCLAYDKRILSFFEQTAAEGLPRSQFFMGHVYLGGWGVDKDEKKGQTYLDRSDWQERGFELPIKDLLPPIQPGVNSETVEV